MLACHQSRLQMQHPPSPLHRHSTAPGTGTPARVCWLTQHHASARFQRLGQRAHALSSATSRCENPSALAWLPFAWQRFTCLVGQCAHLILVPLRVRSGAGLAGAGASCHGGRAAQRAELGRGPLHLREEGVSAVVFEFLICHPLVYLHIDPQSSAAVLWLHTLRAPICGRATILA